jgi:large subunit ribosomal protein L16
MLSPKKRKYRKSFKLKQKNILVYDTSVFGSCALKAIDKGRINSRQIEAARRAIRRKLNRDGRLWIRIFPDIPVTSKPTEVRMGKGKGSLSYWAAQIKPGTILFEIDGVPIELARQALAYGAGKLSIKTKFFKKIQHII